MTAVHYIKTSLQSKNVIINVWNNFQIFMGKMTLLKFWKFELDCKISELLSLFKEPLC